MSGGDVQALAAPAVLQPQPLPPLWAELQCDCTGAWVPVAVFHMSCQRDLGMVKEAAYVLMTVDSRSHWRIQPLGGQPPLAPIPLDPPADLRWPVVYLEL